MTQPDSPQQSTSLTVEQALSHAIAHHEAGQWQDAERLYRAILTVQPDHAAGRHNLDVLEMQVAADAFAAGRYAEAEVLAEKLTARSSTQGFGLKLLGTIYGRTGRHDESVESLREAVALMPSDAEVHNTLGAALLEIRQLDAALGSCLRATELKPDYADAHNNLGVILKELGQFDAALLSCRRALEIRPEFDRTHHTIGAIFILGERFDDALSSCRRALEICPDSAQAYCNMGAALQGLGQYDAAISSYHRAIELDPNGADAHYNLGKALKDVGQLEAALANYRRALEIDPGAPMTTWNLGLILLSQGRYSEGWPCYEMRSIIGDEKIIVVPDLSFPVWRGESLDGKSLLLWPEQGFGDYIQFIRYTSLLKERGVSRLTVRCPEPLRDLLATAAGVDEVITDADSVPPHDYWSFPLSLPLHVGTTVESIPAALPYLRAIPERHQRWRERLPDGRKVGLVWKGSSGHSNDANRSLPALDALRPLWSIPGVTFISLQKGAGEDEARDTELPIIDLGYDIRDFSDTAAIVDQLDLVICVDTAVAHVAGALGKRCWVLLPAIGCDWRWMRDRTDSPWYPGALRLFRQKERGEWAGVIDEVADALREFVR